MDYFIIRSHTAESIIFLSFTALYINFVCCIPHLNIHVYSVNFSLRFYIFYSLPGFWFGNFVLKRKKDINLCSFRLRGSSGQPVAKILAGPQQSELFPGNKNYFSFHSSMVWVFITFVDGFISFVVF